MQTTWNIHFPSIALQHPPPTQIIPQIVRRYPVESAHPLFQPLVVPVYMLDVIRTHDSFPLSVVHHLMRYSCSGLIIPDTVLGGKVATVTRGVQ